MERKTFQTVATKVDEAQGIVEHIIAVMGNLDMGKDIIHPGAFSKTISERGTKVRVLDAHNTDSIMRVIGKPRSMREIGKNELPLDLVRKYPDAVGALQVETQYLMNTPEGRGAFERIQSGAVDEYSIGYDPLDFDFSTVTHEGKEVTARNLRTLKLYEYSPVLWAMNPATTTLSAKEMPSEGKPWNVFKEDGKWRVYKLDADGNPTGEALGEHESEEEARAQVRALYANEGKDEEKTITRSNEDMDTPGEKQAKAGRRVRSEKIEKLRQLQGLISEIIKWADYDDEEEEEELEEMTAPEGAAETKEREAGAGPDTPPTQDNLLLKLIELEQSEIDILEV